jgi:hypothetical protein
MDANLPLNSQVDAGVNSRWTGAVYNSGKSHAGAYCELAFFRPRPRRRCPPHAAQVMGLLASCINIHKRTLVILSADGKQQGIRMINRLAPRLCLLLALVAGMTACASTGSGPAVRTMEEARSAYLAKDYQRALQLMRQEAELGNPHAQYTLGYMYYYGQGVAEDMEEALKWIRMAAAQGNMHAMEALGTLAAAGMRPREQSAAPAPR